jgi:hypothetical protein
MILPLSHDRSQPKDRKEPAPFDILCGKDKTFNKHQGNRVFRQTISAFQDAYAKAASKQHKMGITKEIVQKLRAEHGSRFVKLQKGQWQEISDQMARDKVSHALRFAAKGAGCHKTIPTGKASRPCTGPPHLSSCLESESTSQGDSTICCGMQSSSSSIASQEYERSMHAADGEEDAVVESLFDRQRLILKSLRFDDHLEDDTGSATKIVSVIDRAIFLQKRSDAVLASFPNKRGLLHSNQGGLAFDSLRSEEIEGLLGESLDFHTSQEWAFDMSQ